MTQPDETTLSPNPDKVNAFHRYSDSDSSTEALHHTLGTDPYQSSPGDHNHDGRNSKALLAGTVTGSRGGNAALASLLTTLASRGLIVDGTTP